MEHGTWKDAILRNIDRSMPMFATRTYCKNWCHVLYEKYCQIVFMLSKWMSRFIRKKGGFFPPCGVILHAWLNGWKFFFAYFTKKSSGVVLDIFFNKIFQKKFEIFFDFFQFFSIFLESKGGTLWNRKKISNFFWKISLIKNVKEHPW